MTLLGTVADCYHFVEADYVLFHDNTDVSFTGINFADSFFETDKADGDGSAGRNRECEVSVEVGGSSLFGV